MDMSNVINNLGRKKEYQEGLGSESARFEFLKKEFGHPTNWYYLEYFKFDMCPNMFRHFKN